MITLKPTLTLPAAGLSGFETPLTEEEAAIQASDDGLRVLKAVLQCLGRRGREGCLGAVKARKFVCGQHHGA